MNLQDLFGFDNTGIKSKFLKTVVRGILNECLDQLYILRSINVPNDINFSEDIVEYVSVQDRYMGVENHDNFRLDSCSNNYEKLASDINMLINILKESNDEITFGGTFSTMTTCTEAIRRMDEEDKQVLIDKKEHDKTIELLRNQCEEERLYNIRTIEETNAKSQKLRFEVEDVIVYGRYEISYFENWEKSRQEQNIMSCENKENVHNNVIMDMKNKIEIENRCHLEFENYIEESRNDLTDEINYWMKHYDDEIERREMEMMTLRADVERITDTLASVKQTYETRTADINDWLEYKRIKKEKEDRIQLEIWAATKIQAWWRGTMYRKRLGPYRRKKGKGKGKDKKGDKKKKK